MNKYKAMKIVEYMILINNRRFKLYNNTITMMTLLVIKHCRTNQKLAEKWRGLLSNKCFQHLLLKRIELKTFK